MDAEQVKKHEHFARMRGESSNAISMYSELRKSVGEYLRTDTPFNARTIEASLPEFPKNIAPKMCIDDHTSSRASFSAAVRGHLILITSVGVPAALLQQSCHRDKHFSFHHHVFTMECCRTRWRRCSTSSPPTS